MNISVEILGSPFGWRDFRGYKRGKRKWFFWVFIRVTLEKKIGGAQLFFSWAHQNSISPNWGENTEGKQGALLLSVLDKTITSTATSTFIFWTYLLSFLFCFCFFFNVVSLVSFFFFFFSFLGAHLVMCFFSHQFWILEFFSAIFLKEK